MDFFDRKHKLEKEFKLSEKMIEQYELGGFKYNFYKEVDIKEFIKRLKDIHPITQDPHTPNYNVWVQILHRNIDKLAGIN